jgi:hypothetical protein
MRIIAISFGTLVIVAAVPAVLQSSVYQSLVSQSISRYSADEQVSLITAVKLYRNKITPEIKIRAAQAWPFHNKSPEDFLFLRVGNTSKIILIRRSILHMTVCI